MGMLGSSQEGTLHGWLTALPDEVVQARPVLSVYYAFAILGRGSFEAAEARLRDAERWLDTLADPRERREVRATTSPSPHGEMVVTDEAGFRSLPGTIAIARAYQAGAHGDVPGAVEHARRALDLLPEDDLTWGGAAASILGIAYWSSGELEAAYRSFADGMARLKAAGQRPVSDYWHPYPGGHQDCAGSSPRRGPTPTSSRCGWRRSRAIPSGERRTCT